MKKELEEKQQKETRRRTRNAVTRKKVRCGLISR